MDQPEGVPLALQFHAETTPNLRSSNVTHQASVFMEFLGKSIGVVFHFLTPEDLPDPGIDLRLLHLLN